MRSLVLWSHGWLAGPRPNLVNSLSVIVWEFAPLPSDDDYDDYGDDDDDNVLILL